MKKDYELINRAEIAVVIKKYKGRDYYQEYFEYLEVDAQLDHNTVKLMIDNRGEENWTYRLMRNMDDSLANWQGREQAINYYMGEEAIVAAEKQVRKNLRNLRKLIKEAQANPVWQELKKVADVTIDPHGYRSDCYYHDAKYLYQFKPEKFLWFVNSSGTYIIGGKSEHGLSLLNALAKERSHAPYFWTGNNLVAIEDYKSLDNYYQRLKKFE